MDKLAHNDKIDPHANMRRRALFLVFT